MIIIIAGCMKSGKSKKLLDLIDRAKYEGKNFKIFCPECLYEKKIKTRLYSSEYSEVIGIKNIHNIFSDIKNINLIFIDEIQFIDYSFEDLIIFLSYCQKKDIDLVFSGLDLDFKSDPFTIVQTLMSFADKVIKLHAVCEYCKSKANRTLRLNNGKPERKVSQVLLLDGNNPFIEYKAVCAKCYEKLYKENI